MACFLYVPGYLCGGENVQDGFSDFLQTCHHLCDELAFTGPHHKHRQQLRSLCSSPATVLTPCHCAQCAPCLTVLSISLCSVSHCVLCLTVPSISLCALSHLCYRYLSDYYSTLFASISSQNSCYAVGEHYALRWETKYLEALGSRFERWLAQSVVQSGAVQLAAAGSVTLSLATSSSACLPLSLSRQSISLLCHAAAR